MQQRMNPAAKVAVPDLVKLVQGNDPDLQLGAIEALGAAGMRTILAPGRAQRPEEFTTTTIVPRGGDCPFCEGHEDRTPPEIWAHRPGGGAPDSPGWTARAVPNLYPALASAATCFTVPATSAVSVLVIDWTTTGAVPPTITPATATARD